MSEEKIIKFPLNSKEIPYCQGEAFCIQCNHVWEACAPEGVINLECPSCSVHKGLFRFEHQKQAHHWKCNCGNMYFNITPDGAYCPNCGLDLEW